MKVFRLCREEEIKQILNNQSCENVGSYCSNSEKNSHNYNEDVKYLHFFKKKSDLLYLNTFVGRYICIYDIPDEMLSKFYGYGNYRDYIRFVTLNKVEEFAVPSKLIKFDYLKSVSVITQNIDFEDFFEDDNLTGFIKEVYSNQLSRNQII